MNCAKCNKGFTCGCQKTKAADGKIVHKTCLKDYNTANGGVVYGSTDSFTRQVQKAKENLNYNPYFSLQKGLKEAVKWYWKNL